MDTSEKIDCRFLFGGSIFGIRKEDIRVRDCRSRITLMIRRVIEFFRTTLSHEGATQTMLRRAQNRSLKIAQAIPCGTGKVSIDNQKLIAFILLKYEWQVKHIVHNGKYNSNPLRIRILLTKVTDRVIAEWNTLIQRLEGQWILHYGNISYEELVIRNTSHLVELLEACLSQKLLKNFVDDREKYVKLRDIWKAVVHHLKLHHELMMLSKTKTHFEKQNRA